MRVKICGITRTEDTRAAAEAGVDAIGLNFVAGPRKLDPETAITVADAVPPMISIVGLIRVEAVSQNPGLLTLLERCRIHSLQLYGHADEQMVELFRQRFELWQVIPVKDRDTLRQQPASWARAIVLDAYQPGQEGGTGRQFCWEWLIEANSAGELTSWPPIILAGGLKPENVTEAVCQVNPYGVDVSSGVEVDNQPGAKDPQKMKDFIINARQHR